MVEKLRHRITCPRSAAVKWFKPRHKGFKPRKTGHKVHALNSILDRLIDSEHRLLTLGRHYVMRWIH